MGLCVVVRRARAAGESCHLFCSFFQGISPVNYRLGARGRLEAVTIVDWQQERTMARDLALERAWRERMRRFEKSGLTIREFCEQEGLELARVDERTIDKLRSVFPPWEIPPNPWDLGLTVQFNDPTDVYRILIESVIEDPNVDALAMQLHPTAFLFPKELLEVFCKGIEAQKPVVLWIAGIESGRHETLEWLEEKRVLAFSSPEKAIRALSTLYRLSRPNPEGRS